MDPSISQQIAAFIAENGHWAGPICFTLALAASVIGTNFVVPVGTILIAVGTLVGGGLVSWTLPVWAAAGAAGGTALSFAFGRWLGPRITGSFLLRKHADLVERAHLLFAKYGAAAVIVGYFSGPLRAVVGTIAGIVGMQNLAFQVVNAGTALVWAFFSVAQGAIIGAAIGADHPLFVVAPIATPLFVAALSVGSAALWAAWRRGTRRNAAPMPTLQEEAYERHQGTQQ